MKFTFGIMKRTDSVKRWNQHGLVISRINNGETNIDLCYIFLWDLSINWIFPRWVWIKSLYWITFYKELDFHVCVHSFIHTYVYTYYFKVCFFLNELMEQANVSELKVYVWQHVCIWICFYIIPIYVVWKELHVME